MEMRGYFRKIITALFMCLTVTFCKAQKPPLDTSDLHKWEFLYKQAISNDGKYLLYSLTDRVQPARSVFIQAINGDWKLSVPGVNEASFTDDGHTVIFIKPKDSLCIQTLGSSSTNYILNVASFKLFKQGGTQWLAYKFKDVSRKLVLWNPATGSEMSFDNVADYWLSGDGNVLVLKTESIKDNKKIQSLRRVTLPGGQTNEFWQGNSAGNIVFDNAGDQVCFIVQEKIDNQTEKSIWYHQGGTDSAVLLANNRARGIDKDLKIDRIQGFSNDGKRVFLMLKEKDLQKADPGAVKVDVWSYTDAKLQSQQLYEAAPGFDVMMPQKGLQSYMAIVSINDSRLTRLQQQNEQIKLPADGMRDDLAVITKTGGGSFMESNWNNLSSPSFYIISTITGERKLLPINYPGFSRNGQYLYGTDTTISGVNNNFLVYDLKTMQVKAITKDIPVPQADGEVLGQWNTIKDRNLRVAAWLAGDKAVLIYDRFDIWQLDPAGIAKPVNITNGYGRRHNITFRFIRSLLSGPLSRDQELVVSAFDNTTKQSGFYKITIGKKADPQFLTMGAFTYNDVEKAQDANVYLLKRESAAESANCFLTSDFKNFVQVTDIHPEIKFNWLTSEVMSFKTLDGHLVQGALYKPGDFDPKKKYPVIFDYYEIRADEAYEYHTPEASTDRINIPWFVSNGYLVFTPDIYYTVGETGQSALNAIAGAAKYLSRFPWVDSTKLGLQGHSFGGYETNYVVSHTNIFAAAISAAGASDLISGYGDVMFKIGENFWEGWAERGQGRIGATLWQRPDLYIKNSPIFNADRVKTPLLMMNNKEDGIVNFSQGVEFFTALRRLGKRAWMLQYDGEDHSIYRSREAGIDYTVRMTQFFDHYLKGAPAPVWMTKGIPARLKGIESGFEYDTTIKTPLPSPLTNQSSKR